MDFRMIGGRVIKFFGYSLVMTILSLCVFEVLLRAGSYRPNLKMYDYTCIFDENVLLKIKSHCAPDINELGYRGAEFSHAKSEHTRRVLFLGDSFVMGRNVIPGETIAAALGTSLNGGYEVFNMGVLSYGPDQSLVAMMDHGLALDPDMVVLGIFAANDFQDIARNRLYSLDGGGRLVRNSSNVVTDNVPKIRTFYLINRLQYLLQPKIDKKHKFLSRKHEYLLHNLISDYYDFELLIDPASDISRRKINVMGAILEEFHEVLYLQGIKFGVVIIPSYPNIVDNQEFTKIGLGEENYEMISARPDGLFGLENIVAGLCESLEIPYVNLYEDFLGYSEEDRAGFYDDVDWHLSAAGNRVSGRLVAEKLVAPEVAEPAWRMNRRRGRGPAQQPWR